MVVLKGYSLIVVQGVSKKRNNEKNLFFVILIEYIINMTPFVGKKVRHYLIGFEWLYSFPWSFTDRCDL